MMAVGLHVPARRRLAAPSWRSTAARQVPCSHWTLFYANRPDADQSKPLRMSPNAVVEVKSPAGRVVRFGNADRLAIGLVYKTSFDKANRTSAGAGRGMGLAEAIPIFAEIRETVGLPVL